MPANLENPAVATGLESSVFIPIPKKGYAKVCANYHTIPLISHATKVMLKILQASLQQYMNLGLPDVQTGFRKDRGTRGQIANIHWILEKAREFQKNIYFCFIDYTKVFDCVDHNKLWKLLKEMGIPDYFTFLLRNLYACQEATVRTSHGTTNRFKIGEGVHESCILSPCLFNLYAQYIMITLFMSWMTHKLESRLPGEILTTSDMLKLSNGTLMAEIRKELKSLIMRVKEDSEKAALKLNIQETKIMAFGPNTLGK